MSSLSGFIAVPSSSSMSTYTAHATSSSASSQSSEIESRSQQNNQLAAKILLLKQKLGIAEQEAKEEMQRTKQSSFPSLHRSEFGSQCSARLIDRIPATCQSTK